MDSPTRFPRLFLSGEEKKRLFNQMVKPFLGKELIIDIFTPFLFPLSSTLYLHFSVSF